MRKNTREARRKSGPSERRRLPRKNALLSGVLAQDNGEKISDCLVRDMNTGGAAIACPKILHVGWNLFFLDTANHVAYLARVAWTRADQAGLLFIRRYAMSVGLPPRFSFLWRLLLEAKLNQVDAALAAGVSTEFALSTVGLTGELIHQMTRHSNIDLKFERLLLRARRLLTE